MDKNNPEQCPARYRPYLSAIILSSMSLEPDAVPVPAPSPATNSTVPVYRTSTSGALANAGCPLSFPSSLQVPFPHFCHSCPCSSAVCPSFSHWHPRLPLPCLPCLPCLARISCPKPGTLLPLY